MPVGHAGGGLREAQSRASASGESVDAPTATRLFDTLLPSPEP